MSTAQFPDNSTTSKEVRAGFFSVTHANGTSRARTGRLTTSHGAVETPCFLPIASHGTLRALTFEEAAACGTKIVMANAWHIYREAGPDVLQKLGGAHVFMHWTGILFTDSGGYQVFSLRDRAQITEEGVSFGSGDLLTPEHVVGIQKTLGSDIMIVLDDCAPYPCTKKRAWDAVRRTTLWARKSLTAHEQIPRCYAHDQELWGIVQGGAHADLRRASAEELARLDFRGYGIGGLSIGMPSDLIREMTQLTCELLPFDRPRHLLGVGLPTQILDGIEDGADTFDCVLPIRKAQRGVAYTRLGVVRYKDSSDQPGLADTPLDLQCGCSTCKKYSRAELRRLYREQKDAAGRLAAIHNLTFYHGVLEGARHAIRRNQFSTYKSEFVSNWISGGEE